jgi:hypothetical protein
VLVRECERIHFREGFVAIDASVPSLVENDVRVHIVEYSMSKIPFPVTVNTLSAASAFRAPLESDPESNDGIDCEIRAYYFDILEVRWF